MHPEPTPVVAYRRVSSDEQASEGSSLQAQEELLGAWCRAEGLCIVEWFCDPGLSGADPNRPELKRALAALDRGAAAGIAVTKLDRLTRNLRQWLDLVDERFRPGRQKLYVVRDPVDVSTAMGWLLSVIRVAISQFEVLNGVERTADVMALKRSKGERLGTIPYGKTLGVDGKTLVDQPEERAILEALRTGREEGWTFRRLADQLNEANVPTRNGRPWRASTVQQILARFAPCKPD